MFRLLAFCAILLLPAFTQPIKPWAKEDIPVFNRDQFNAAEPIRPFGTQPEFNPQQIEKLGQIQRFSKQSTTIPPTKPNPPKQPPAQTNQPTQPTQPTKPAKPTIYSNIITDLPLRDANSDVKIFLEFLDEKRGYNLRRREPKNMPADLPYYFSSIRTAYSPYSQNDNIHPQPKYYPTKQTPRSYYYFQQPPTSYPTSYPAYSTYPTYPTYPNSNNYNTYGNIKNSNGPIPTTFIYHYN